MKNVLIFAILAVFLFDIEASAASLGETVENCFASLKNSKGESCKRNENCDSEDAKRCLEKLGILGADCKFNGASASCGEVTAMSLFPETKGCKISFAKRREGDPDPDVGTAKMLPHATLYPDKSKSCSVGGFTLQGASLEASTAEMDATGKWRLQPLGFPVGLDLVVSKDAIIVTETNDSVTTPWVKVTGADFCHGGLSRSFASDPNKEKIKKQLGFGQHLELYPRRHFGSRKIAADFPTVSSFKLLKQTKICGISIPANTQLFVEFDLGACYATVDGALGVSGIPVSLVPALKGSIAANEERLVECTTRVQQNSNVGKLQTQIEVGGKAKFTLPKLDWQDCVCKLAENRNL